MRQNTYASYNTREGSTFTIVRIGRTDERTIGAMEERRKNVITRDRRITTIHFLSTLCYFSSPYTCSALSFNLPSLIFYYSSCTLSFFHTLYFFLSLGLITMVISNQKPSSVASVRYVYPILLTVFLSPFLATNISLPTVSPSLPFSPSFVSMVSLTFATAVVLGWHRFARSNLINSCKFNYWLTAFRLHVLYLSRFTTFVYIIIYVHIYIYTICCTCICMYIHIYILYHRVKVFIFFMFLFLLFLSLSPYHEQTHLVALVFFLQSFAAFGFSAKICGKTRLLVNCKMWDTGFSSHGYSRV